MIKNIIIKIVKYFYIIGTKKKLFNKHFIISSKHGLTTTSYDNLVNYNKLKKIHNRIVRIF